MTVVCRAFLWSEQAVFLGTHLKTSCELRPLINGDRKMTSTFDPFTAYAKRCECVFSTWKTSSATWSFHVYVPDQLDSQVLPTSAGSLDASSSPVYPLKSCHSVGACLTISEPVAASSDSEASRDHVPMQSLSLSPCTLSQDSPSLHPLFYLFCCQLIHIVLGQLLILGPLRYCF